MLWVCFCGWKLRHSAASTSFLSFELPYLQNSRPELLFYLVLLSLGNFFFNMGATNVKILVMDLKFMALISCKISAISINLGFCPLLWCNGARWLTVSKCCLFTNWIINFKVNSIMVYKKRKYATLLFGNDRYFSQQGYFFFLVPQVNWL